MNWKFPLIFMFFWCLFEQTKKLVFIQELFRHGARYPIYPKKNDFSIYAEQEHSAGELTTQGKKMHYLLGKQINKKYWNDIFNGTQFIDRYNQSKFFFKSTDVNRTIESCQSHLYGLFQNKQPLLLTEKEAQFAFPFWPDVNATEGYVFPDAIHYHPLPIHVEKTGVNFYSDGDFLRSYAPENCPKQSQWEAINQQGSFSQMVSSNKNISEAMAALSKELQLNNTLAINQIAEYFDNYETGLYLGRKTLKVFSNQTYSRTLNYIYTMNLYINLFFTEKQRRVTSSGFFKNTIQNIKNYKKNRDVQWVVYSAHDTTVGNMLAAMNMTNAQCVYEAYLKGEDVNNETCISAYPTYTASIIFEVHQNNQTNQTTFKIAYGGVPRKIPFCNWQLQCDINILYDWYQNHIKIDDYLNQCGVSNSQAQLTLGFAVLQFGVIVILIILLIKKYLEGSRNTKMNKEDINQQFKDSLISDADG